VPERGREDRGEGRGSGSLPAWESAGDARSDGELRRRISSDWWHLELEKKEGWGRGARAFYRRPIVEEGLGFLEGASGSTARKNTVRERGRGARGGR
jgi:hypothetical protein